MNTNNDLDYNILPNDEYLYRLHTQFLKVELTSRIRDCVNSRFYSIRNKETIIERFEKEMRYLAVRVIGYGC